MGKNKEKAPKEDVQKKLKETEEKLKQAEERLEKENNSYLLLAADFENYKRHAAADRINLITAASEKIILELLPLLDDCERAFQFQDDKTTEDEGSRLIYNKLLTVLKAKGLSEIPVKGLPLDTDTMEAVAQFPVEDEDAKGKVYDVTQKGYRLGEKVIRYAKVVVGQ